MEYSKLNKLSFVFQWLWKVRLVVGAGRCWGGSLVSGGGGCRVTAGSVGGWMEVELPSFSQRMVRYGPCVTSLFPLQRYQQYDDL